MSKHIEELIPEQKDGAETNTEEIKNFRDSEAASLFYKEAKRRLLNINDWQKYAGVATAAFYLCDEKGIEVQRPPQKDDHFKIDIPGPGSITGDGFDWVQIEGLEEINGEDEESVAIRVRPVTNPTNEKQDVAHFFSDEATSCFIVERKGNKVTAAVYGRNEKPNTSAEKIVDKARNAAVATGAVNGFSKLQWKSLVKGFLK